MKIGVLGNGTWGSAMAKLSQRRGHNTIIWARHPQQGQTRDIAEATRDAEIILLGVPSHAMREVCVLIKPHLPASSLVVSLAKGIELASQHRMTQVITEALGHRRVGVMSGPTFSSEVARGAPSAIVAAAEDESWAKQLQSTFNGEDFRVYTSKDVTGVELGGALKNIMAIAAGACVGMGLGDNAVAALITRGVAELSQIGHILGGKQKTFFGLSGMGDLILTCSSRQSRNRCVGEGLGQGQSLENVLKSLKGTAEGVKTAKSVQLILQARGIEAPILNVVYQVLYENKPVKEALRDLMNREPKKEFDDTLFI